MDFSYVPDSTFSLFIYSLANTAKANESLFYKQINIEIPVLLVVAPFVSEAVATIALSLN